VGGALDRYAGEGLDWYKKNKNEGLLLLPQQRLPPLTLMFITLVRLPAAKVNLPATLTDSLKHLYFSRAGLGTQKPALQFNVIYQYSLRHFQATLTNQPE
jgi:hypothetical protein